MFLVQNQAKLGYNVTRKALRFNKTPAIYWCGYGNQFLSKINQYSVKKPTLYGSIQTILCGFKSALNRGPQYLNLHYTGIPCTRVIIDHIILVGIDHFLLVGIDLIYKINKKQVGSGIFPVLISLVSFRSLHGNDLIP